MNYIRPFAQIRLTDIPSVGGKNASIGQMISQLASSGIRVPDGFAITTDAYWYVLDSNQLRTPIKKILDELGDTYTIEHLQQAGAQIRPLIEQATIPDDLADQIVQAYDALSQQYHVAACDVAVRSSATAEDLPTASFAGQQETYLNIVGHEQLLRAVTQSMASLFTDRAIVYRKQQNIANDKVALSVGVQKMVRSDKACAGVAFSIDTESGYKDAIIINGSYGLGELIVKGTVVPDEYIVHKPTLEQGYAAIIRKRSGEKSSRMIYVPGGNEPTAIEPVPADLQNKFCLTDAEILELAGYVLTIEKHYSALKKSWSPMDIEWAKDGTDNLLYIVQARPETIHLKYATNQTYCLSTPHPKILTTGQSIGQRIASGRVKVVRDVKNIANVADGDIIVTQMTDPDWVPIMKRAAAIITTQGGRTCHAAIVSRELEIPALVGVKDAFDCLSDTMDVTVDCSQGTTGYVYDGLVPFETNHVEIPHVQLPVELLVNCADPDRAFKLCQLPVDGVGLARIEFIITNAIGVHPMACIQPDRITDPAIRQAIDAKKGAYASVAEFYTSTLAQGIAMIAAAFYPRKVIVRLSDFKTNEYRNLLGGTFFEPVEQNPMIGFRGAVRYYDPTFKDAFALECAAIHTVRTQMGLTNVVIMVPFVRTTQEADLVLQEMARHNLKRGDNDLEIFMMCEIPSNALLIDSFAQYFDGFSIGSNDLTQLTLGVDRDSDQLSKLFDERDPAVKQMITMAIDGAQTAGKPIGICGQGPSDYPDFADFLIKAGVTSLSLNDDSIVPFLLRYASKK